MFGPLLLFYNLAIMIFNNLLKNLFLLSYIHLLCGLYLNYSAEKQIEKKNYVN